MFGHPFSIRAIAGGVALAAFGWAPSALATTLYSADAATQGPMIAVLATPRTSPDPSPVPALELS